MNEKLMELYSSKWNNLMNGLNSIYEDDNLLIKPTNPLLIKIQSGIDYDSADFRLMIFGQETNGWYEEDDTIEGVLKGYSDFLKDDYCFKYGGHFWNGISRFNSLLSSKFPDKNFQVIWNNIVKIGKSDGKGMPPDYIYSVERERFSVIRDELSILKPNFILFLTGPYYDWVIEDNFGQLKFESILPYTSRQMSKLEIGGIPAIRTYHPNYLWRNDINSFFNTILNEIRICNIVHSIIQ